ncbi:hypothetical protein CDAR_584581, partial [Caerostris darwini]
PWDCSFQERGGPCNLLDNRFSQEAVEWSLGQTASRWSRCGEPEKKHSYRSSVILSSPVNSSKSR